MAMAGFLIRTEAVEDIEEGDEHHGCHVHSGSIFAQMEGSLGEVPAFRQDIGQKRDGVGHGGEDDEGARQVEEGCGAADRDGTETGRDDSCGGWLNAVSLECPAHASLLGDTVAISFCEKNLPTKRVAGIGHESFSLTWAKNPEKGTALSRARAQ